LRTLHQLRRHAVLRRCGCGGRDAKCWLTYVNRSTCSTSVDDVSPLSPPPVPRSNPPRTNHRGAALLFKVPPRLVGAQPSIEGRNPSPPSLTVRTHVATHRSRASIGTRFVSLRSLNDRDHVTS